MPKKLNPETPEEQAKRFRKEARKLIKSGELDPAAADSGMERIIRRMKASQSTS